MNKRVFTLIIIFVIAMTSIGTAFMVQAAVENNSKVSARSVESALSPAASSTTPSPAVPSSAVSSTASSSEPKPSDAQNQGASSGKAATTGNLTNNTSQTTAVAKTSTPAASGTSGKSLSQIFKDKGIDTSKATIKIVVDKSDHTLGIYANGTLMKSYHVELGDNGLGDKAVSGDHKTPEGTFYISEKSVLNPADEYLGTRWMRLSYPNVEDAQRGLDQGLISKDTYNQIVTAINNGEIPPQDTALGGGVGIHGGSTAALGTDWTWGCVGLTSKDVEDFFDYIRVGTKVIIQQ
jgi:lipoprotein-anchoring transpeptidase ErfK/SrfK